MSLVPPTGFKAPACRDISLRSRQQQLSPSLPIKPWILSLLWLFLSRSYWDLLFFLRIKEWPNGSRSWTTKKTINRSLLTLFFWYFGSLGPNKTCAWFQSFLLPREVDHVVQGINGSSSEECWLVHPEGLSPDSNTVTEHPVLHGIAEVNRDSLVGDGHNCPVITALGFLSPGLAYLVRWTELED